MEKYIIIKNLKSQFGIEMPVVILDGYGEVLEFDSVEEADKLKSLFQKNSDSGHVYTVKKI